MKITLAILSTVLLSTAVYMSVPVEEPGIDNSGICVVEFNASFNAANGVAWIDKISDCSARRIDIASDPSMQVEHKIVVVPTIIVFNEGEEVERFQANIMMQLEATKKDVQEVVDEIIMSSF